MQITTLGNKRHPSHTVVLKDSKPAAQRCQISRPLLPDDSAKAYLMCASGAILRDFRFLTGAPCLRNSHSQNAITAIICPKMSTLMSQEWPPNMTYIAKPTTSPE